MNHQICDACETVAHCMKNGCIPVQPTTKTEAIRAAPVLVRDLAEIISKTSTEVCVAMRDLGFKPMRSVNMEVSGEEALAVAKHFAAIAQAEQRRGAAIYLVATGETYEGEETYMRHEGSPPPLCDFEGPLYAAAPQPEEPDLPAILQRQAS